MQRTNLADFVAREGQHGFYSANSPIRYGRTGRVNIPEAFRSHFPLRPGSEAYYLCYTVASVPYEKRIGPFSLTQHAWLPLVEIIRQSRIEQELRDNFEEGDLRQLNSAIVVSGSSVFLTTHSSVPGPTRRFLGRTVKPRYTPADIAATLVASYQHVIMSSHWNIHLVPEDQRDDPKNSEIIRYLELQGRKKERVVFLSMHDRVYIGNAHRFEELKRKVRGIKK